jgi:mannose-6-phosphate isomerase-like protein (cupin superfamily)
MTAKIESTNLTRHNQISVVEALQQLPKEGDRFAQVFSHGSLSVEIYAPRQVDPQQPHRRDEVYIVVSGRGEFINGESSQPFEPGDFLFVPAGVEHRFVNFSADLVVWVLFYGPEGGEVSANHC